MPFLNGHLQRVVSSLGLTEASSALRRKVFDKSLSRSDGQAAFDDLRQDVRSGLFRLIDLDRRLFDHAAQSVWATQERLRTLDALHLAAAALDGMDVATADQVMAKAGKNLGMTILWSHWAEVADSAVGAHMIAAIPSGWPPAYQVAGANAGFKAIAVRNRQGRGVWIRRAMGASPSAAAFSKDPAHDLLSEI